MIEAGGYATKVLNDRPNMKLFMFRNLPNQKLFVYLRRRYAVIFV